MPTPEPIPSYMPTPTPTPIPSTTPKYDVSTTLKSTSGDGLYYRNGDEYMLATVGYYLGHISDTYYKQGSEVVGYKYTGWQEINEKNITLTSMVIK